MNATIKQYIPAGSEVVVYSNGAHKWHTTKTNIPIVDPKPENCPVREVEAVTIQYKGYTLWFLEAQANVELTEEQENSARRMELVKLEYDIPAAVMARGQIEHPSTYLWARGVRTSGSMWILPKGNVPLSRLRELTRAGCLWEITKIDVSDAANKMQRAIASLQTERIQAYISYDACMRSAEERFNDGNGDVNSKLKKRSADHKRIEKELEKKLENVRQGAVALGIPLDWVEGTSMRTIIRATVIDPAKREWETKSEVTEDAVTRLRNLNTTEATALADSLANERIDPRVVADYLEEHDSDVFSLRDVYGDQ